LLAFSSDKRLAQFPNVPTVSETVPDFVMTGWNGYFAPAGTPRPIIDRLSQTLAAICRDPEVVKIMSELSIDPIGGTPEHLAAAIQRDFAVLSHGSGGSRPQTAVGRHKRGKQTCSHPRAWPNRSDRNA
jgi:tripartite-type tricarboxylate transporter receptor subunit TctC